MMSRITLSLKKEFGGVESTRWNTTTTFHLDDDTLMFTNSGITHGADGSKEVRYVRCVLTDR